MDAKGPCLKCSLPECDEGDPGCRRRTVKRGRMWQGELDQVGALSEGERIVFEAMPADRVKSLQDAIQVAARKGRLPRLRTRRWGVEAETARLEVQVGGPADGRRWSRWAEVGDHVVALAVGEERAFRMGTYGELESAQNSVLNLWHRREPPVWVRTWRTHEDGHLVLHVERVATNPRGGT